MINAKSTKRALLSSVIALVLCFTMLIGTTFAWFTDSVTSSGNVIKSGTLDVQLLMHNGSEYTDISDSSDPIFGAGSIAQNNNAETLWEPGKTQVAYLAIKNNGNLALKYTVALDVENVEKNLYEVMTYEIVPDAQPDAILNLQGGVSVAEGHQSVSGDVSLGAGATHYFALAIHMDENAGNDYKDGQVNFALTVLATQDVAEADSFDNQYDKDSEYPALSDKWDGTADVSWYLANPNATEYTLASAEALAGLASLVDGSAVSSANEGANPTVIGAKTFNGVTFYLDTDVDLQSLPFNPIGHSSNGKVFEGTFDGQGHTISNLYEQSDLGAWQYEGEYYGLFAYTNGATIKNLTIADAYISSGRNEAAGVVGNAVDTTFSDITISNTTLIAYNNSAGGVAAECYGNCSFTNITVDEETVIGPLWGTYDVRLGGVVGLVQSGNQVTFSNITVACQLDAINDVAANYQYWLYRYSGMLIGQVDGVNGVADPTGYVTCENVTVIYGDWVNYHYCEDADLGAGSYNGPGEYKYARVEAGTGTDGIDLSACNHNDDESHNVLIVFDQLFGGGQGISGLKTYDGVTVVYP